MPDGTRNPPRCPVCSAALAPDAPWCGQCLTPLTSDGQPPAADHDRRPVTQRPVEPRPALAGLSTTSRWRRGPTTFGPVGRMLVTLVLLAPYPWLWDDPAAWLFLVMWTVVVLPVALRDTWARTSLPITPPTPPERLTHPPITPATAPPSPPAPPSASLPPGPPLHPSPSPPPSASRDDP